MTETAARAGRETQREPRQAAGQEPAKAYGIAYDDFLSCVHCGLCTAACPTYQETSDENNSPRGRIYLMRAVVDGRVELTQSIQEHLDLCLDCRACETACPSGVRYGRLIEPFRVATEGEPSDWFRRYIVFGILAHGDRLRQSLRLARWAQRTGLMWLLRATRAWKLLPRPLGRLVTLLPELPSSPELPERIEPHGPRRAKVALFTGCVADAMFRPVHWATIRVLQANGCEVVIPKHQACCGAIHFHAGASAPARELADRNLAAIDTADIDAVIVNVAGCGAMMKEYGELWEDERHTERAAWASKVRDVCEFLDELGWIAPLSPRSERITYHDACHLAHAQGIRQAPRRLLQRIPGLEWCELDESDTCCGAAGTYNLSQPEMSDRLARRKLDHIVASGARTVVSANAGCTLQIEREARRRGLRLRVAHPVELLAESLDLEPPADD